MIRPRSGTSGRVDQRVMERVVAAAALKVAAAFRIGADEIGAACAADGRPGFVSAAVVEHCADADRKGPCGP